MRKLIKISFKCKQNIHKSSYLNFTLLNITYRKYLSNKIYKIVRYSNLNFFIINFLNQQEAILKTQVIR